MTKSYDREVAKLADHIEFLTAKHGHFTIEIDFAIVTCLIASLQLALRHPGNKGYTAKTMRGFIEDLMLKLDKSSPGIAALLRRGDNPALDVPVNV